MPQLLKVVKLQTFFDNLNLRLLFATFSHGHFDGDAATKFQLIS